MLSVKICNMLNKQVNAEIQSAYLYLSMSLDADHKSMPGIANWFYVQWQEELHHSRILQNYINSRDGKVVLAPIEPVPNEWQTTKDMFASALRHECNVTTMIHELTMEAAREQDIATVSRMIWFIDEQVEEETSARTILHRISQLENNRTGLMLLDQELGERKYDC